MRFHRPSFLSPRHAARYETSVVAALAGAVPDDTDLVTEADLERLPAPVADYVRRCGAVGRPRITNFRATIRGRIRSDATARWMPFTGEQTNTFATPYHRHFHIDATMLGIPISALHTCVGSSARMEVVVAGLHTLVDATGPEMDRSESVTLFDDLCILAPAALVDAPIVWESIDDHRVRGTFTNGDQVVSAELHFDDAHHLVDFVSDDRMQASSDGEHFVARRWSTPVRWYTQVDGRRVATLGTGRWHGPEGEFTYLEFELVTIDYNVGQVDEDAGSTLVSSAVGGAC